MIRGVPVPRAIEWNKHPLLFGQMREDSQVDVWLAERIEARRAMCITSGGCAAFALACAVSERVVSLDCNPSQTALAQLKWHLCSHFPREQTIDWMLRPQTGSVPKDLPDVAGELPVSKWMRRGLHRCGRVDQVLARLAMLARLTMVGERTMAETLSLDSPSGQRHAFQTRWNPRRLRLALHVLFWKPLFSAIFPVRHVSIPEGFGPWSFQKVQRLVTATPGRRNPFAWELFLQRTCPDETGRPDILRNDFRSRIRTEPEFVTGAVEDAFPEWSAFDLITLSNVAEAQPPQQQHQLLSAAGRALTPGGLVVLRSIFQKPPMPAIDGLRRRDDYEQAADQLDRSAICSEYLILERA